MPRVWDIKALARQYSGAPWSRRVPMTFNRKSTPGSRSYVGFRKPQRILAQILHLPCGNHGLLRLSSPRQGDSGLSGVLSKVFHI